MEFTLAGVTRDGHTPLTNPGDHSVMAAQDRVIIDLIGPDGEVKQHIDHQGNLLATYGINNLVERIATGGEASDWISAAAIGTDTTAANSTDDALGNSTQIVHLSAASMVLSDGGDMTLEVHMTYASDGNAAEIHEHGIFGTNAATAKMVARAVLGTDSINRGASDEIRVTHEIIFATG